MPGIKCSVMGKSKEAYDTEVLIIIIVIIIIPLVQLQWEVIIIAGASSVSRG